MRLMLEHNHHYFFSYLFCSQDMESIRIAFTCLVLASGVSVFFFFPAAERERVKGKNFVHLKGHPGCCFLGPRGVGGGGYIHKPVSP